MSNKEYRPTLAQLRTFVTIAENKHFGTAAAKLAISQPSLSQALVALETGLGVQLIERSTRRVIVTPSGEALLPYAKATLNGNLSGPLTIGMIPTIAPYILPNLLHLINAELPELEPRIVEDQTKHLLEQLRDGHIDLAVLAVPTDHPGLIEIPLYTEDFVVVVPHDHKLAGRDDLTIDALRGLNLLLLDDGHCLRDQVVDLCRSADFTPDNRNTAVTRPVRIRRARIYTDPAKRCRSRMPARQPSHRSIQPRCQRIPHHRPSLSRLHLADRRVCYLWHVDHTRLPRQHC